MTDCLNFGNPERPEVYWQLSEAIEGLADACRAFAVPIVSGNVSLYNETNGSPVAPTPIVGMVGLIEDRARVVRSGFRSAGDSVMLLGPAGAELGCSEYLAVSGCRSLGPPPRLDLELERRVQEVCRAAARRGLIASAHDCSEGGLAVTLSECCIAGEIGFRGEPMALESLAVEAQAAGDPARSDAILFGEGQSRIVVSCAAEHEQAIADLAADLDVPCRRLGIVGGGHVQWSGMLEVGLEEVRRAWHVEL